MIVEASWPATARGGGKFPIKSHATSPVMNAAAIARLAITTRRARRQYHDSGDRSELIGR